MLTVPFTLDQGALPPVKGHRQDAAYDLALKERAVIQPMDTAMLNTGVHVAIPEGHVGLAIARSSTGKRGLALTNSVGVIDPGYTGPILLSVRNTEDSPLACEPGDRVAQLLIIPTTQVQLEEVATLEPTERGDGGFGSTGTR